MRFVSMFRRLALVLAVVGLSVASTANAADPARSVVSDVALQQGNALLGQILDQQGKPQQRAEVVLLQQGKLVAFTRTDKEGRFAFRGVRAGVHQLDTPYGGGVYRLWAPRTAPPSAKQGALIVSDETIARGQVDDGFMSRYGPALRGAAAGGLLTGGLYWALDYNAEGS